MYGRCRNNKELHESYVGSALFWQSCFHQQRCESSVYWIEWNQLKQTYKLWCPSGEDDSNYCSFDNLFLRILQNVDQKSFVENSLCCHVLLSLKGIFDVFLIVTGLILLLLDIRELRTTTVCHSVRWWLMTLQRLATRQHRKLLTGFTFTEMTFQGTLTKECATRTQQLITSDIIQPH